MLAFMEAFVLNRNLTPNRLITISPNNTHTMHDIVCHWGTNLMDYISHEIGAHVSIVELLSARCPAIGVFEAISKFPEFD
jgi:hypothetical protein